MTTLPEEYDPAEVAEFWRLTQEALAKYPEALNQDPVWDNPRWGGLQDD